MEFEKFFEEFEKDGESKENIVIPGTKLEHFASDRVYVSGKVRKCVTLFEDIISLAKNKSSLYSLRQELIDIKYRLMDMSNLKLSILKSNRSSELVEIKKGKVSDIKPSNEKEMQILLSSKLKDIEYDVKVIDSQIEFIADSTKTVDNMIYGIEAAIKLEEYRYGGKRG